MVIWDKTSRTPEDTTLNSACFIPQISEVHHDDETPFALQEQEIDNDEIESIEELVSENLSIMQFFTGIQIASDLGIVLIFSITRTRSPQC